MTLSDDMDSRDRDIARELLQLMVAHDRERGPETHVYMAYPNEPVPLTSGVPDGAKPGHLDDLERRGCLEITDYTSKGAPKWVVLPVGVLEADRAEESIGSSEWSRHVQVLAAVRSAEQEAPGGRATVADVAAHLDGDDGQPPRLVRATAASGSHGPRHPELGTERAGWLVQGGLAGGRRLAWWRG